MKMMRPALLVTAGALALSACGGGGLSKADYTQQAEGVCSDLRTQLAKIEVPASPDQFSAFYDKSLDAFSTAIDKLKTLDPPSGDADEIKDALTDPLGKQIDALRDAKPDLEAALKSDDPASAIEKIEDPLDEDAKIDQGFLRDYGLDTCASASAGG